MYLSIVAAFIAALFASAPPPPADQPTYVGMKICSQCHSTPKSGKQADIWSKSKHADAYNALTSPKALEIGKAKGIANPAESKECLECHSLGKTVAPEMLGASFDIKNGVQCETCHGAGSAYKMASTMRDKAKAIEAGMVSFKDEAAIESFCKTCHNEKSPTFKEFKFKERWDMIKHYKPKE